MLTEFQNTIHTDREETRNQVVFGAIRVTRFIKDVVAGKPVDDIKYQFDEEFIKEIHNRFYYVEPGTKGELRQTDSSTLSGEPVSRFQELPWKMHLFGRFVKEQTDLMAENPEDLVLALNIASAAHYGLVMHQFHPFDNGNGRTARALMNAILMSQTYELTAYGLAIPPIPILRPYPDDGGYVNALRKVDKTGILNPFMAFIAKSWSLSVSERLQKLTAPSVSIKTAGDTALIAKLEKRATLLDKFVSEGVPLEQSFVNGRSKNGIHGKNQGNGKIYKTFEVPDYFATRYIK